MAERIVLGTITVEDAKRKQSKILVYFSYDNLDLDALGVEENYMQYVAQKIDPYIDGQIVAINISQRVPLPLGLKTVPLANCDVEETAIFLFDTTDGFTRKVTLPTMNDNKFIVGTDIVNESVFPVDFPEILISPSTTVVEFPVSATDGRGDITTAYRSGRKVFKPR